MSVNLPYCEWRLVAIKNGQNEIALYSQFKDKILAHKYYTWFSGMDRTLVFSS